MNPKFTTDFRDRGHLLEIKVLQFSLRLPDSLYIISFKVCMDVYCRVERWGEMYSHTQGEEKEGISMSLCWICATQSSLVLDLPEVYWHLGCTQPHTFTFTSSSRIALLYFCIYKYVMMIINNVNDIAANGAIYKVWLLGTFINPNQYL